MKKRVVCFCLLFVIILTAGIYIPISAQSYATVEYYGREALSKLENGENMVAAYDKLAAGVEVSEERIDIGGVTDTEFKTVFDAYRRDFAHHFWIGNAYSIRQNSSKEVVDVSPTYTMTKSRLSAAKVEFENALNQLLANVSPEMSEFERELALHDALAARVTYDLSDDAKNKHNAYGALVEGRAVCEGYAEALQCLLHRAGIGSFLILGQSVPPSGGAPVGHEWNAVLIDGEFYHVDVTWDDQDTEIFHAYFNVPTEQIKLDHTIDSVPYALPECGSTSKNYFEVKGGKLGAPYSVDAVAAIFEGRYKASVCTDDANGFFSWLGQNMNAIINKAGLSDVTGVGAVMIGKELIVTFKSPNFVETTAPVYTPPAPPTTDIPECSETQNTSEQIEATSPTDSAPDISESETSPQATAVPDKNEDKKGPSNLLSGCEKLPFAAQALALLCALGALIIAKKIK